MSVVLLAFVGSVALYWESLKWPLFFDDMVHLRWLDWHSLASIWLTAEGLGYYRPLTMSVWKVSYLLLGYHEPAVFHFMNVFLHALNSALTGYIAWRVYRGSGRAFYALLATLIFLSFPFSYQAIPSSSSLSKPLIATLTLASVLLYWEARRMPRSNDFSRFGPERLKSLLRVPNLFLCSLLVGVLAPFAYETGVVLPLAIVAVELLGYVRKEFEPVSAEQLPSPSIGGGAGGGGRLSPLPILYMLLIWGITLPLIIWLEPKTEESVAISSALSLWQNGTYFVEGLLFPITPIGTPLESMLQWDWYVLLTLINLVGLAALLAFYRWSKHLPLFLYALSWFVVGILPQWLMLDFSYVITSPRILYLSAVGSALLWAGVPILLWVKLPNKLWSKVIAIASILGMLSFNTFYVRQKVELGDAISIPLRQAAAEAVKIEKQPASLLYLNVPAWVAPKEPIYRIGTEGLTFIPEYTRVQDFVYVNTGLEHKIKTVIFNPIKQDWRAYIGYVGYEIGADDLVEEIEEADGVYLTTYSPDELRFVEAGALQEEDYEPSDPPFARFGDQMVLQAQQTEVSDREIVLKLWWYCQQVPDTDVTVFAHVYDQAGQLIAQGDGYPLAGLFAPRQWEDHHFVRDIRYIPLPEDLSDKPYTLAIGWYDTATGQRLPAFDQQNQPATNDAIILLQK